MKQVIIIGYGPAGISAALYLKHAGIDPFVIGKDHGSFSSGREDIDNYYGFSETINGKDLIENGLKQAKRQGIELANEPVIGLSEIESGFIVKTEHHEYQTKAVLLATGKRRLALNKPGFKKFIGKGISLCATCDGFFYRKKKLAIIGTGKYMLQELSHLKRVTDDITIFTNGKPFNEETGYPVVTEPIKSFVGKQKLQEIHTTKNVYPFDGAFVAIGTPSALEFAQTLGIVMDKQNIVVDENYETNIPGLFAAGDIIGGKLQIAKAVYDGMMVAEMIYNCLNNNKKSLTSE